MKRPSIYTIKTNVLKATISRGIKTNYDWLLEIESLDGNQLIGKYQTIFFSKKTAVKEFQRFRNNGFLIKQLIN